MLGKEKMSKGEKGSTKQEFSQDKSRKRREEFHTSKRKKNLIKYSNFDQMISPCG